VSGVWVLSGNLCPNGAVVKPVRLSAALFRHQGRAVVFESVEDLRENDDPALEVDENSILVLKGCGPRGYPGMPEVGNMPLPRKAARERRTRHGAHLRCPHERNRFRDGCVARGSGSGCRWPLAMVRNGDEILFDGPNRRLELLISNEELAARSAAWKQNSRRKILAAATIAYTSSM